MSVIRVNKDKNFVVMSKYHLKDKRLSLKAKGLLSQMLSLPDNWDYTISGLVAINKENESAIKSCLSELKEFGYLVVTKKMPNETGSGRIEYIYDIFEKTKQEIEKQGVENQGVVFQGVENPIQLNTDNEINNNEISNNNNRKEIVCLSNAEKEDLIKKIGDVGFWYYEGRLKDFIIQNDAKIKNHYKIILKWAKEDGWID